jgi:phosphonate transport system ATP-binding protein
MAHFAYQRVSTLSGGQQQRVAIARALMQQAKVILADEPIASLDPESARIVMDTLRDINQTDGITVVVTLHQVDYALRYCEHASRCARATSSLMAAASILITIVLTISTAA